jgi:hypothetical protein
MGTNRTDRARRARKNTPALISAGHVTEDEAGFTLVSDLPGGRAATALALRRRRQTR